MPETAKISSIARGAAHVHMLTAWVKIFESLCECRSTFGV